MNRTASSERLPKRSCSCSQTSTSISPRGPEPAGPVAMSATSDVPAGEPSVTFQGLGMPPAEKVAAVQAELERFLI